MSCPDKLEMRTLRPREATGLHTDLRTPTQIDHVFSRGVDVEALRTGKVRPGPWTNEPAFAGMAWRRRTCSETVFIRGCWSATSQSLCLTDRKTGIVPSKCSPELLRRSCPLTRREPQGASSSKSSHANRISYPRIESRTSEQEWSSLGIANVVLCSNRKC